MINDARLDDGNAIENIYFANVKMDAFEQPNIRGQVCFMDLVHWPDLVAAIRPLLEARNAVGQQVRELDRKVMKLARRDAQVRRFMTGRQPLTIRHGLRDREAWVLRAR